ncbi:MAG: flippase-like domain-containing protein [Pseudarcicella sp.]|nr:flippase-like domain-containing protein [Pseudarcicella sp.]MBP6409755.1 flippase-like domain-containing protein [Pseudarcicella sp.]
MSKKIIQYLVSLVFTGLIMSYVFKNIKFVDLISVFQSANYYWIALSTVMMIIAHIARAQRWRMLLEPLGQNPTLWGTSLAVFLGYFANYIVPRMGEVSKCSALQKSDNVPFQLSFGAVLAERIFDVVVLLLLLVINLLVEFDRLKDFFISEFSSKISLLLSLMAVGIVGFLLFVFLLKKYRTFFLNNPLLGKIYLFINGIIEGVLGIKKLKKPGAFIFYTCVIWLMYFLAAYVLFFALAETQSLGLKAGLTVLVMGSLGMAAPTVGGIGPYHFLVGNILVLYGLSQKSGIDLAVFIHGSQMLMQIGLGIIAFLITFFSPKKA